MPQVQNKSRTFSLTRPRRVRYRRCFLTQLFKLLDWEKQEVKLVMTKAKICIDLMAYGNREVDKHYRPKNGPSSIKPNWNLEVV